MNRLRRQPRIGQAVAQQHYRPALLADNLTRDHTAIAPANLHPHMVARSSGSLTMA